jgi:hypothetical protein
MGLTKLKTGATVALVIVLLAFGTWQHLRARHLAAEKAAVGEQLEELTALREENMRLASQLKTTVQDSESQNRELLRLRAQAATLRQTVQENARLKAERDRLAARASAAPAATTQENEPEQTPEAKWFIAKMNFSRQLALRAILFAQDHNGLMPTNLNATVPYSNTNELTGEIVAYGIREDQFELLYQGSLQDLKEPSRTILAREKESTQAASGKWAKTYAFADGHSEVHVEPNNDFALWEQQHLGGGNTAH